MSHGRLDRPDTAGDSASCPHAGWAGGPDLAEFRWATMGCVTYGTLRLATDLATRDQLLALYLDLLIPLRGSVVIGLVSVLPIVFGGQSFLDVSPALLPLESRPPNPLSLS